MENISQLIVESFKVYQEKKHFEKLQDWAWTAITTIELNNWMH